jgi:hypothetical protein
VRSEKGEGRNEKGKGEGGEGRGEREINEKGKKDKKGNRTNMISIKLIDVDFPDLGKKFHNLQMPILAGKEKSCSFPDWFLGI